MNNGCESLFRPALKFNSFEFQFYFKTLYSRAHCSLFFIIRLITFPIPTLNENYQNNKLKRDRKNTHCIFINKYPTVCISFFLFCFRRKNALTAALIGSLCGSASAITIMQRITMLFVLFLAESMCCRAETDSNENKNRASKHKNNWIKLI